MSSLSHILRRFSMQKLNMYFFTSIILCGLFMSIFSRPTQVLEDYNNEAKEYSYGDSNDSDDYLHSEKSLLKQDDSDNADQEKDYLENRNDAERSHPSHNNLLSTNSEVKRTAAYNKASGFFKSPEKQVQTRNRQDEIEDPNDLYIMKSNSIQNSRKGADNVLSVKRIENKRTCGDRHRRQIKQSETNKSADEDQISTQKYEFDANADEETAIRQHIKKLSKEELDELLHSLSDEKRILLKNIIDNSQQENEPINKREIAKKAGANEENSLVGTEQSYDFSKVQGGSDIKSETALAVNEKLENNKKSDSGTDCSKNTETANTSEKNNEKVLDNAEDVNLEADDKNNLASSLSQASIQISTDNEQESPKIENKREIKSIRSQENNVISKSDILNTEDLYCSENEELSSLWNDESKLYDGNNNNKRDTAYNKKSFRYLEESFPNSNDNSDLNSEINMVPLIRVKRNNLDNIMEKRDIKKVPSYTNVADDGLENSEGENEISKFQDNVESFDKGTSFVVDGQLKNQNSYGSNIAEDDSVHSCSRTQQFEKNDNNVESDIGSLGSDTDTVLSGVKVDDNNMYSSVSRNKRTPDVNNNEDHLDNIKEKYAPKLVSSHEENDISEQNNVQRYQENDAFGSLPRNYEEELGRFKRIRRLKPLPNLDSN